MGPRHVLPKGLFMLRWSAPLVLAVALSRPAAAQDSSAVTPAAPATVVLSLADALKQARAKSPLYRQALNDAGPARWGVRNAYGSLLPSVVASGDMGYSGSGQSNLGGGLTLPTSAFLTSGYSLALQWQLSGRSLQAPAQQKALQHATDEDIGAAGIGLTAEISTQYLSTLQARAQVAVAQQQVRRNEDTIRISLAPDERLRLYAGQADPRDPSRFTIECVINGERINGERGTIEGVLHADDVVAFQPMAGEGLKRRWRTWDTSTTRPWWDGASQRHPSTLVELSPGSPRPL